MTCPRLSRIVGAACWLLILSGPGLEQTLACATVTSDSVPQIYVAAERAVIIWDQAQKLEHFIRQADIVTPNADIGFLVPTPQSPELAEADQHIFNMATLFGEATHIAPTNYRSPWTLVAPMLTSSFLHLDRLSPPTLLAGINDLKSGEARHIVLAEHDVAGYHATTLSAEDESSISAWLATNGYHSTPELKAWLKPYIAGKWTITAFKLMKVDDTDGV